ncbi:MAG: type II toxin-antitoxin system VapC family toxin [Thermodesulfobacteriota bacterium]|nr:type II toxin-antitoxin system VapC family toxin [Thermodesulfobacteriota bacterium]
MNNIIVPDANVFLEMIYGRQLQVIARQLISHAIANEIQLVAPSLLLDEITEVLCGNLDNLQKVQKHLLYLEQLVNEKVLLVVVPSLAIRMKAIEIARTGNPKSGYPELSDSLYHALAIVNDAIFVTNDFKHVAKVNRFGHVEKLADYQKVFERIS